MQGLNIKTDVQSVGNQYLLKSPLKRYVGVFENLESKIKKQNMTLR